MKQRLMVCGAAVLAMISLAPSECLAQNAKSPAPARGVSPAPNETSPATKQKVAAEYGKLPLSFQPNQGQTDPRVKFLSRGPGYNLFLLPRDAVLMLQRQSDPKTKRNLDAFREFAPKPESGLRQRGSTTSP